MTTGTKNLTEVVDLALAGVDTFVKAKADGKIDAADLGLLLSLIPAVGPAIDGIGEIPAEIKDLDVAEAQALVAHVMAKLTITDDKAIAVINASLKMLVAGLELAKALQKPAAGASV